MTEVGVTIGVEEEYHLVDAVTGALADVPEVAATALDLLGADAQTEISTSQLEVATPVCASLDEVRTHLSRLRRGAADAARQHGCRVLASGTHPFSTWRDQRLTAGDRYGEVHDRLRHLALQQLIAGLHVHVVVPDRELAVRVLDRLRPDLPVLLAMSASSPFWEGVDTGYASYRTQWFGRFPMTGTADVLGDAAAHDRLVAGLVASGMVRDGSHLYWDARLSTRFPTVEVRVADAVPLLDDAVLQAALCRALVRAAAREAVADAPLVAPHPQVVRAARWRAARDGLSGELLDLHAGVLRPAHDLVRDLVARLEPDLSDDADEARALTEDLLVRGTSADRQRRVHRATGYLGAVVQSVVDEL